MTSPIVRAINFLDDGVTIDYANFDDDMRANGLMKNHILFIPHTEAYADMHDRLIDAVLVVLRKGLKDFDASHPPFEETPEDSDSDEPGPYDHPDVIAKAEAEDASS